MSASRVSPLVWLGLALVVLLADQFTKLLIVGQFALGDGVAVNSFLNLVRVHNSGAAFSFLAQAGGWQRWFFTALGVAAAAVMAWLLYSHPTQKLFGFALALLIGGAIGNVLDRLFYGHVIDFLDFHWNAAHFETFNLADSAITLGVICLILDEVLRVRRQH